VAAEPQWYQRGRRRGAGPDRLGCLPTVPAAAAAPDGHRRVEQGGLKENASEWVTERSGASRSLASLRTRLQALRRRDRGCGGGRTYGSKFETRSARKSRWTDENIFSK